MADDRPPPPDELVGALQDRVHRDLPGVRVPNVGRVSPPVVPDGILGPTRALKAPDAEGDSESGQRRVIPGGRVEPGEMLALPAGGVGDSPARALNKAKAKDEKFLAKLDGRIRKRATAILDAALRAPELSELPEGAAAAQEPPEGWTKRQLRIAADATNSMKAAPAYLSIAQRVAESYRKSESEKPQAPQINAEVVQVHVSVANYPRRRLNDE